MQDMQIVRALVFLAATALTASIFWAMGADPRGLGPVLAEMAAEPWSVVTLIDLYLGFFLGATVIWLFEKSWPVRIIAAAPVFLLGNVWTALWFVVRLPEIARRLRGEA
jgi:hypothetical protein